MLDEILFKVLHNKWKYFDIGSQKDFENRMIEVDAITKRQILERIGKMKNLIRCGIMKVRKNGEN